MKGEINIIVPMYNVAKYLPNFLDSVLKQTYKNYKMFVVNDCSTDGSQEILDTYMERFGERLVCLSNEENLKLGRTRNRGLDEAEKYSAEYTAFLDSDDIVKPDYLQSMVERAEESNADLVICGMERVEDNTGKIICTEAVAGTSKTTNTQEIMDEMAFINPAAYNKLYKTECIKGVRFKPMSRSEDTCYLLEILPRLKTIAYTNKVGYCYRVRSDSLTGEMGHDVCVSMYKGFAEMAELYKAVEYQPFQNVLETQVFIRSMVGGVSRASFSNMKDMRKNIREAQDYMNKVFPKWKQNPYLCFGKRKSRNKKETALKISAYMYRMHMFGVFICAYYIMLKLIKKDVRM